MDENIQELQTPLKPSKDEKRWVRRPYNWAGATLLIQFAIIYIIANLVVIIAGIFVSIQPGTTAETMAEFANGLNGMSFTMALANLIGDLIAYPLAFLIGCIGLKVKLNTFFSTKGYNAKFVILAVIVALGAQSVGSFLANAITEVCDNFGITLTTLDTSVKTDMATNIMMYALACVIAPIFEEMIFRGIVLKAFSKVSIRFGIIASAALFGLTHQNIPQAVNAFLIGLVFGYVAYKAGSIIPTIIMHFALNANGMIMEAVTYLFKDYSDLINIILTVLFVGGAVAVLIICRNSFFLPKDTKAIKKRTFPLFITSWAVILSIIVDAAFTVMSIKIK